MGEFESALAATEADTRAAMKLADGALRSLKKAAAAAATGEVNALGRGLDDAEAAIQGLREQFRNTRDGWQFDVQTYAEDGRLTNELLETARAAGLGVHEQDGRIFSYPVLVRVLPSDRALLLDKERVRRIRPTVVVERLRRLRDKKERFRPADFVEALHDAYLVQLRMDGRSGTRQLSGSGPAIALAQLYDLLTLLPGQKKEYTKADFTRDLYLVDRNNSTLSRNGRVRMEFSAATGTRLRPLHIVDEHGRDRDYFAVSFQEHSSP